MYYLLFTINFLISTIAVIFVLLIKLLLFTGPGAGKQFGIVGPPSKQNMSLEIG